MNFLLGLIFTFSVLTSANASSIHDLKVDGVPLDQVETIKTLSGLLPGDEVDASRINRAAERIHDYFDSKGYPQATVTPEVMARSDKATIVLKVVLGQPIRIAELKFLGKATELTEDLKFKLMQALDFKEGEPLDKDRLKEFKRLIETTLSNLNYIDSRVMDITRDPLASGERVSFTIELGERVVFSVFGNEYFTRSELLTLIEDQITVGLGRDFVTVILNRLKDRYAESGFLQTQVNPYIFEAHGNNPRKVAYEIVEGPRTTIRSVIFDGNEEFTNPALQDLFYEGASSRIQSKIYNAKMVEEAAAAMISAIRQKGYLSAKLIAVKSEPSPDRRWMDVRVFLSEGLQTHIQAIDLHGNRSIPNDILLASLGLKEGDSLNLVQLEGGIDRIKREYRNHGFLDIKITNEKEGQLVSYSERNQFAYLTINVEEGAELRLASIRIYGNEVTKTDVIEREIQLQPGEVLFESKVIETEERIRRLGVFSQVKLDLTADTGSELTRNMKISVVEGVPGNSGLGFGFRNDLGPRVFGEVSYSNLWGLNHGWALTANGNHRLDQFQFRFAEYKVQLSYVWPWVFLGETTFRPSVSAEAREYLQFDANTYQFNLSLDRMIYRPLKVSAGFTYVLEFVNVFNDSIDPVSNGKFLIGSIAPSIRIDLRDNPLAPRKGFFGLTSFEFADTALGSQGTNPNPPNPTLAIGFGRFNLRADYYIDVIPRVIWSVSTRAGYIKNYGAAGVPVIKQFALGGENSVRGYVEQEINLQNLSNNSSIAVFGSSSYLNLRMQTDFLATQSLTFGPFIDAGDILLDTYSFQPLYGAGVGLRYITPIGPINFDWGFKLNPPQTPANASSSTPTFSPGNNDFYFSIGVI